MFAVTRMSTIMLTAGHSRSLSPVSTKPNGVKSPESMRTWRRLPVNMPDFSSASNGKVWGNWEFPARDGGVYGKESHIWCQRVPAEENEEIDVSEVDTPEGVASGVGSSSQVSGCDSYTLAFFYETYIVFW